MPRTIIPTLNRNSRHDDASPPHRDGGTPASHPAAALRQTGFRLAAWLSARAISFFSRAATVAFATVPLDPAGASGIGGVPKAGFAKRV